ncbi:MAG: metallophosphoesterase [Desulfocapsaceae bacterium]|jgi:hypothetical protein|nr:metallophosphoesterase [Desulfocapsaceae bacterium]
MGHRQTGHQFLFHFTMKNPLHKILKPIKEVQLIRGIELPVGLEFRQLVVTGPPGAGKSYYINQIRGWPNEGYLDLKRKKWWKDQSLVYRPREIHLGIPYVGHRESLTVFDQEWLESPYDTLTIDYPQIRIPPRPHSRLSTNWIDRYIFEFILPDPKQIYKQRLNRQKDGYFPVDANLTLEIVDRQVQTYSEIALYLHRAGLNVYIRRDIHEPPMLISEKGDVALPPWAVAVANIKPGLNTLDGWRQLFTKENKVPWFSITRQLKDLKSPARISHDGKSFDIVVGRTHLKLSPEIPLGANKRYLRLNKNWIIRQPDSCSVKTVRGFARICQGETITLGRANKDYDDIFHFKKDVAKRHVSISNINGDLIFRPIEQDKQIKIVRLDEQDSREEIPVNRLSAMFDARALLGGKIDSLEKRSSLSLILEVNEILAAEPFRPPDDTGIPGGLLELPDEQIPVIVGDLHGQVDNLLKILTENCILQSLRSNNAFLCILGDAVHSEISREMTNMENSVIMMDLILSLKRTFPKNVFYIRGNHDDFSPDLAKNGIPQGLVMKRHLMDTRGSAYVEAMQTFYDRLPYIISSPSFIAIHAGPPRSGTSKDQLINIRKFPEIAKTLTNNRVKRPHYLSGYGKTDIKALRKTLDKAKSIPVIVGHTPLDPFGSIWQNVGSIKNHHIVYSSHQEGPAFFVRIKENMVPLTYPSEPLSRLISKMKRTR